MQQTTPTTSSMLRTGRIRAIANVKTMQTKLSPIDLAALWGVTADNIRALIRSGQLPAIDVSVDRGKPRFLIDVADIALFEQRRAVQPPEAPTERRRQRRKQRAAGKGDIKYF